MWKMIRNILMIEISTLLFALSVGLFILPGKILTGGVAGITSLMSPFLPVSEDIITIFLNTFLFVLGSFLYGGMIGGVSMGIMFRNGGSSGGTDAIALIAEKYFKIKVSHAIMVMDTITVLAGLYIYGLNSVLVGLISVILTTLTLNWSMNIYGGVEAKKFEIISDKYDLIAEDIHNIVSRGTTVFDITGGYTGNEKKMLMAIVSEDQYQLVKEIIDRHDPGAFVIISEAKDVNGEGFTFEPRI